MGAKSPYHINVLLGSIGTVIRWHAQHKNTLTDYLAENEEEPGERTAWWLQKSLVKAHFLFVCRTMKEIQGKAVLVCEQSSAVGHVYMDLLVMYLATVMEEYAATTNRDTCNPGDVSLDVQEATLGPQKINYNILLDNGKDLNTSTKEMIVELEDDDEGTGPDDLLPVLRGTAALYLTTLEALRLLNFERTSANLPGERLPPALPHDLAELSHYEFVTVAAARKQRFERHRGIGLVDDVVAEHRELRTTRELRVETLICATSSRKLVQGKSVSLRPGRRLSTIFLC